MPRLRSAIILHGTKGFTPEVVVPWLASFSDLVGIVRIEEPLKAKVRRAYREYKRSGVLGLVDAVAMRATYKLLWSKSDENWLNEVIFAGKQKYGEPPKVQEIVVETPNSAKVEKFLQSLQPDFVLARCKFLLKQRIFSIPKCGTFVIHPGITPEYRNAHGCFWAMVNHDFERVGATLLKIDKGIDTGPVLRHFYCKNWSPFESHIRLQTRVVWENLDEIANTLIAYCKGDLAPVDVKGRASKLWGQPKFSAWARFILSSKPK